MFILIVGYLGKQGRVFSIDERYTKCGGAQRRVGIVLASTERSGGENSHTGGARLSCNRAQHAIKQLDEFQKIAQSILTKNSSRIQLIDYLVLKNCHVFALSDVMRLLLNRFD